MVEAARQLATGASRHQLIAAPRACALDRNRRRVVRYASMSLGFHIYPDVKLLFIRGHGVVTQTECVHTLLAWLREPDYASCVDALFDITDAESTPKVAELRELIALRRQHHSGPGSGPRRLAIVTSKPIAFAVAQVFGRLMRQEAIPLHVQVFPDRQVAWEWLRPSEPLVDPR
jgi:hypothetical protein